MEGAMNEARLPADWKGRSLAYMVLVHTGM